MKYNKKNKWLIVGVAGCIVLQCLLSIPAIAIDTEPPRFQDILLSASVILRNEIEDNLVIEATIIESSGFPQNVTLNLTGSNGLVMNLPMMIDPNGDVFPPAYFYHYVFNSSLNPGSYHFYIWAEDSTGNSNHSENYYFVVIENRINYVHVSVNNTNGPWDGTAQHPFKTIGDGLDAANPNGTVFIHKGSYDRIFSDSNKKLNQAVVLEGENKDNTIIDRSSGYSDFGIGLSGTLRTYLINLTIQYSSTGILLDSTSNKRITNCIIQNCITGILFEESNDNTITNCTFQNNTNGINFYSNIESTNNQIVHNNFIGNLHQITGTLGVNIWDNGRTGNYWDNYHILYPSSTINITTGTWATPMTLDAHNSDHHPWVNQDGSINRPPQTPTAPTGQTAGYTNNSYTYITNIVSDPDGDPVFYLFNWGDGTTTNWMINPTANHQWTISGNYQVKVKAKDSHDSETQWSSPLFVQITTHAIPENQLQINTPASITEGNVFTITITVNGAALENTAATFAGNTQYTNTLGQVSFTAPMVSQNTEYPCSAQHTGYTSVATTIVVLNQVEQLGYIYGVVRDTSTNTPLQTATVTVILSAQEHQIIFTDIEGRYRVLLPVGTYSVEASKQGYTPSNERTIHILENSAIEQNFDLEQLQTTPPGTMDQQASVMDYTIQQKATLGEIGAQINLQPQENTISYYRQELTIALHPVANQTFSFTINGNDNITGTILVCKIGPGVLSDLDNITLTYDNHTLNETTDLETFFNIQENTTASWFRVLTTKGLYILIRVPHFSQHTITISSEMIKILVSPAALMTYFVAFSIIALLYIIPIVVVQKKK
jgi:parallel beta-helix repeat protein